MKKLLLSIVAIAALVCTSCGSDDDGDTSSGCVICALTANGDTTETEICDNGDGTVTVIEDGQSFTIESTVGSTFEDLVALQEASGGSCN